MFFNSVKEINRLRKKILSKGMSNIYYWEKLTYSNFGFSKCSSLKEKEDILGNVYIVQRKFI